MKQSINIKNTLLELSSPIVMGILNVTPDSFSDGGKYNDIDSAIKQAIGMLEDGASIIDIGGYSSRPGAEVISVQEEIDRVVPVIEKIYKENEAIISIDTFRSEVAIEAIAVGASLVNDISAGDDDDKMIATVAQLEVPFIAMHKQGKPQTMQTSPQYNSVVDEVYDYLEKKIAYCKRAGVTEVIIDPGFGFGKTISHNYALLQNLDKFTNLDVPLLVGVSRKSMVYKALNTTPDKALNGTTWVHAIALQGGANILRVHDVRNAMECVKLYNTMMGL